MKTELLPADHPVALHHTVDVLRNGGLVAFPTDTVYGLASLPFQAEHVERLYAAKGRNSSRAIAILVGRVEDLPQVTAEMGKTAQQLARQFWPGPLTLVVAKNLRLPDVLSQTTTVGVRMPDHPLALALLQATGPLAVTSANRSGMENTLTAEEVMAQLGGRIHLILDGGRVPGCVPSTVVDCTGVELVVLREGPISLQTMQQALADAV
jgi:L-threonylcarbamoyladenylate synthase